MMKKALNAHKFGGSSMANAERFIAAKELLSGKDEVIVVSAVQGVTSSLQDLLDCAAAKKHYQDELDTLRIKHLKIIEALFSADSGQSLLQILQADFQDITDLLHAINLAHGYSKEMQDMVLSYGEQWSAQIMTALLAQDANVLYLNASLVLYTAVSHDLIEIDWKRSQQALNDFLRDKSFDQIVITGFLAANAEGKLTTLTRNSGDVSGAIFANLFDAKRLTIWKDVDGFYSADPSKVSSAFVVDALTYKEALELAYFGSKVIHPWAITPAMEKNIPIAIRNSINPQHTGSTISAKPPKSTHVVKGLSCIEDIALISVEGAGMVGVCGIAGRVFNIMREKTISVILISQASSEYSICFAVREQQAAQAIDALKEHFAFELLQHRIDSIVAEKGCAVLAAVGDGMVGAKGVAGRLCSTLAKADVNIRAIAQGSSERNISVVIKRESSDRALRAVHAGFYLSNKTISIGVIGHGGVGTALLEQIRQATDALQQKFNVNLLVRGITDSKHMLLDDKAIALDNWSDALSQHAQPADLDAFVQHIRSDDIPHAVIIDCTASQVITDRYLDFLNKGIQVVTPNKRAVSGDFAYYQKLQQCTQQKNVSFLYETTVCAGLPIIKTLQDLIQTGDEVVEIQGVVSGSLAYIFNHIESGKCFSEAITEAKQLGYTEPDPRDDLSGLDVARKVVTLAREMGMATCLEDVKVHNLVPESLRQGDVQQFMQKLPEFDAAIQKEFDNIRHKNETLKYVGVIKSDGSIEVAIKSFAASHPFSQLKGTDNMIIFRTRRYFENPLVIQGPGAGGEVTAAGVFADLLRVVSFLS